MNSNDFLLNGLPEEHRLVVMRPAEEPDPSPTELRFIRETLETPEMAALRGRVEASTTPEERRAALKVFNHAFLAAFAGVDGEPTPPG